MAPHIRAQDVSSLSLTLTDSLMALITKLAELAGLQD